MAAITLTWPCTGRESTRTKTNATRAVLQDGPIQGEIIGSHRRSVHAKARARRSPVAGASGDALGVDGIKEYRIVTGTFQAEYGMAMGSQMVAVSKGGTNQFHGDVFEYFRNSALDANDFFQRGAGSPIAPLQKNQFGGAFGGPIKKDKTFFY